MRREEVIGDCRLILGDCLEVLPTLGRYQSVVSDPPYPNNAGHFTADIDKAILFFDRMKAGHCLTFWTEMLLPPVPLPMVAVHVWYRTNTNRPDNYEPIYEFHADKKKRASRVLPYSVISPGLTGVEASGHPTEKHPGLMMTLVKRTEGTVLDPFMGSGTTGVACMRLGRKFKGVEVREDYFDIACRRIEEAYKQPRLFAEPQPQPKQEAML